MKRVFASTLLTALLVFSGCGGDDDVSPETSPSAEEAFTVTEYQSVSLQYPISWEVLTREQSPENLPSNVLMLLSNIEPWGSTQLFANVSVAKEVLPKGTSHKKYLAAAVKKTKKEVVSYESIEESDISVGEQKAKFLHFLGKNTIDGDMFEWMHVFVSKDDMGYIVSGVLPVDATVAEKDMIKKIVLSMSFVEEKQE